MSEQHTPEPWETGSPRHSFAASEDVVGKTENGDDFILARCNYNFPEVSRPNARRIVACVNACLGISSETLERPGFTVFGKIEELGTERDELRAEVDRLSESAKRWGRWCSHAAGEAKKYRAEAERLREALTPSGETKAEYMGRFLFRESGIGLWGVTKTMDYIVPWTTIKEIMAAIIKRAALDKEKP